MISNRLSVLGGMLAIVVILALGWQIGVAPMLAQADAAAQEQSSVEAQNAAQEAALVALRSQFSKIDKLRSRFAALQKEIPGAPLVEDFMDELTAAAAATGVTLVSVEASEATAYLAAPSAGTAPTSKTTAPPSDAQPSAALAAQIFTIGVSIIVAGGSAEVLKFTSAVQHGTRLFLVTKADFTAGATSTPGGTLSGFLYVVPSAAVLAPTAHK